MFRTIREVFEMRCMPGWRGLTCVLANACPWFERMHVWAMWFRDGKW